MCSKLKHTYKMTGAFGSNLIQLSLTAVIHTKWLIWCDDVSASHTFLQKQVLVQQYCKLPTDGEAEVWEALMEQNQYHCLKVNSWLQQKCYLFLTLIPWASSATLSMLICVSKNNYVKPYCHRGVSSLRWFLHGRPDQPVMWAVKHRLQALKRHSTAQYMSKCLK